MTTPNVRTFSPTAPLAKGITLLEASAGTGKTHSIVHLFLRLVAEEGIPVDGILVVTFTEAATSELRDRIREALARATAHLERALQGEATPCEDPVIAHLSRPDSSARPVAARLGSLRAALESFDEAAISTIHGFCLRILRQNAFESGVEFDAEVLPDVHALVDEIVRDFLVRELHGAPPGWVRFLARHGVGLGLLTDLGKKAVANPEMPVMPYESGLDRTPPPDASALEAAFALAQATWAQLGSQALGELDMSLAAGRMNGKILQARWLPGYVRKLEAWLAEGSSARPEDGVQSLGTRSLVNATKPGHAPPRHVVFDAIDALLDEVSAYDAAAVRALEALALRCIAFVRAEATSRKRARHLYSYDDFLQLLARGLDHPTSGPRLREAMRRQFRAALIDEFQDTDATQWRIFRDVFDHREGRLVLIGDPKQAIYAFRGADIFTYLRAQSEAAERATLPRNWRSDGRHVDAVNHLFGGPHVREPFLQDEIRFQPVDVPQAHRADGLTFPDGPRPPMAIRWLPVSLAEHNGRLAKGRGAFVLARIVADDIARLLESGAMLGRREDSERPISPRDVAVLVRTNLQARQVQSALWCLGVPGVVHGADSVWASDEACDLLDVVRAMLEPTTARVVRSALATRLIGLDATRIAALETDHVAWERWVERFRALGLLWHERGFVRAIRALLGEFGLVERLLGEVGGERVVTNLLHLVELLHEAATAEGLEPERLLVHIEERREDPGVDTEGTELRLESDADAVEIVTMHRSKGLQYPIVFCPYLYGDARLKGNDTVWLRCHDPSRQGALVLDVGRDPQSPDRRRRLDLALAEQRTEALRIAYVALTRARHRTVLYWGRWNQAETSPLAHLLHQARDAPEDARPDVATTFAARDEASLMADVSAIVETSRGALSWEVASAPVLAPWRPAVIERPPLRARVYARQRPLDAWWRRSSFSQMAKGDVAAPPPPSEPGKAFDEPAPEPDATALHMNIERTDEGVVPLATFPRGPGPGTFLHEVLEKHDFPSGRAALEEILTAEMRRHAIRADQRAALLDGLGRVISTPLDPGGPRLADLARSDRLDELEFDLPVAGGLRASASRDLGRVTARGLAGVFSAHQPPGPAIPPGYAQRLAALRFLPIQGFLTGSIDLVFRHGGRYVVVDYKSNHLGDRPSDYAAPRLGEAMAEHHYLLQALLYTTALHRFLCVRLENYDFDRDMGGVRYLFLRGMMGADGGDTGVWRWRPSRALVEATSDLLASPGHAEEDS